MWLCGCCAVLYGYDRIIVEQALPSSYSVPCQLVRQATDCVALGSQREAVLGKPVSTALVRHQPGLATLASLAPILCKEPEISVMTKKRL